MRTVELLIAWTNKTWDTVHVEMPKSVVNEGREAIVKYAEQNILPAMQRQPSVALVALYHIPNND